MKKSIISFLLPFFLIPYIFCNSKNASAKSTFTAMDVLEKTIKYHDPNGLWNTYKGKLFEVTVFANNYVVKENIEIDKPNDFYLSTCFQEFGVLKRGIEKGKNIFSLDGKDSIPDYIKNNWGLSDERIKIFKAEHHSHFGLPMELKKSGMVLDENVQEVEFDGRKCYALSFSGKSGQVENKYYEGDLILYVDSDNYCMRGTSWTANGNKGFSVFAGEFEINKIKIVLTKCVFSEQGNLRFSCINMPVNQ